jgi:hypothetical protein
MATSNAKKSRLPLEQAQGPSETRINDMLGRFSRKRLSQILQALSVKNTA